MIPFKKILVPVDFSKVSDDVMAMAVKLAKREGAELTLVHVWELPAYAYGTLALTPTDLFAPLREGAEARLDAAIAQVRKDIPQAIGVLKHGSPWREILSMIEETRPDLVIVGTHGRRGVERVFLGSVAEKLVRSSPVPVLTLHGSTPKDESGKGHAEG